VEGGTNVTEAGRAHVYEDALSVREARAHFFQAAGLGADGGHTDRFVHFRIGPLRMAFPNFPARRRAVRLHDLHHLATGYDTTWTGESEISAWELGSGCGGYLVAWMINLMVLPLGLVLAPGRSWRAFRRGRASDTLYREAWDERWLLLSVGELRERLGLGRPARRARVSDHLLYGVYLLPVLSALTAAAGAVWWLLG
jgi:hypothetical protein